jgi:hypothetical protein
MYAYALANEIRATTRGKIGKSTVFPGFCIIEQWQWQQQNGSAANLAVSPAKIFHCSHALAYLDPKSTPISFLCGHYNVPKL